MDLSNVLFVRFGTFVNFVTVLRKMHRINDRCGDS